MSAVSKGAKMELTALRQDLADGWKLMPNGRPKRVKYTDCDVFGIADFVVYTFNVPPWNYRRKYVQVTNHAHYAEHKRAIIAWVMTHRLRSETYELAIYREPHWEGRGKKRKWIPKTTWKRELV